MVTMAVNYHLVEQDDAELIYDYEYLITPEEDFEMQMFLRSKKFSEGYLRELRRVAFLVRRASTLDNVDILGEDYIRQMKRDLPAYTFMVSIMNVKMQKVKTMVFIATLILIMCMATFRRTLTP